MNPHDPKSIVYPPARQYWRAFVYVMHLHENHSIKRAGVAGLRARAEAFCHVHDYANKRLVGSLMFDKKRLKSLSNLCKNITVS